jgi:GNAT superfamily N-acetyltransferase
MGYIKGLVTPQAKHASIQLIYVKPIYRKKGVATLLLQRCIDRYGSNDMTLLACPVDNDVSLDVLSHFYERHGFEVHAVCQENPNEISYSMCRSASPAEVVDSDLHERMRRRHMLSK